MKIALFGDSYGVGSNNNVRHWFDIVCERLNLDSANFSENGSSLYYSYNKFLEHQEYYDKVVFILTGPHRFPVQVSIQGKLMHIPGLPAIDNIERMENLSREDIETIKNLKSWILISDPDFSRTVQYLLVKDILSKRKDTVLIPVFRDSLNEQLLEESGLQSNSNMVAVLKNQLESLNYASNEYIFMKYYENENLMTGHFTEEVNKLFSEVFYERLITGSWKSFDFGKVNHQHSFDNYYIKK